MILTILLRFFAAISAVGLIVYYFVYKPWKHEKHEIIKAQVQEAIEEKRLLEELNEKAAAANVDVNSILKQEKKTRDFVAKFKPRDSL